MKIVFATGGTGGHIFPAVAVAEALHAQDSTHEVIFLGTGRELERKLLTGFDYLGVDAFPVTGKGISGLFKVLLKAPSTIAKLRQIYREQNPDVVIGFGGYPTFFPVLVAWLSGIPTAIQEQNASLGLANRILRFFVKKIFISPTATLSAPISNSGSVGKRDSTKVERVKNPVRKIFYQTSPYSVPQGGSLVRVLVVGGSQGAMRLNSAVTGMTEIWKRFNVQLLHQAGIRDRERVEQEYRAKNFQNVKVLEFINEISRAYDEAHLVISRAGAMTVAEVEASGRPAIFVPLPIARAHQAENAEEAVRQGAAIIVEEGADFAGELARQVERLLASPGELAKMAERAALARAKDNQRPAEVIANTLKTLALSALR